MNNLIDKVSPLTKAIIWLTAKPVDSNTKSYRAIDYLLDGLLTSSINANPQLSSRVLIGEQFGKQLHIYIAHEVNSSEFKHFLRLIEGSITTENNILIIDEIDQFNELIKYLSPTQKNNIVNYI